MEKKIAFITDARVIAAEDIWINENRYFGKFVLRAKMVVDRIDAKEVSGRRVFSAGEDIRTSFLVRIDIEKGEFETLNTIYKIVPEAHVDAYRMTDPS